MFTKAELIEQYKSISIKPLDFLRIEHFGHDEYPCVSIESGSTVYRGDARDFESAAQFYCNCLIEWDARGQDFETWKEGWRGWLTHEIDDALCIPILATEFPDKVARALNQVAPLVQLPEMNEFVAALQMEDEWNDIGVLAEFKNEFLYVAWHTTA